MYESSTDYHTRKDVCKKLYDEYLDENFAFVNQSWFEIALTCLEKYNFNLNAKSIMNQELFDMCTGDYTTSP